jgi:tetratricopeptide (TPR) repeat protein
MSVMCGMMPPLARGFCERPELSEAIEAALRPGQAVALTPPPGAWKSAGPTGKTQLAAAYAGALGRAGGTDLIAWIDAGTPASVLSGFARAAAALGSVPAGEAESAAASLVARLGRDGRSWLVVFDGLSDQVDLGRWWPAGPSGAVLVTTRTPMAIPGHARAEVVAVGGIGSREALPYLVGRLSGAPETRQGAADLVDDLGGEPLALSQAADVIAASGRACRDYHDMFTRRRDQIASVTGEVPAAAAVTWTLSYEYAEQFAAGVNLPGILVFGALLDGNAIPAQVFTTQAACAYFGADAARVRAAISALDRAGLLTIGSADTPPVIWISPAVQALIRAVTSAEMAEQAARAAADALMEAWPDAEPYAWTAESLRGSAMSLQGVAGGTLLGDPWHPLVPRTGQSLRGTGLAGPAVSYWGEIAALGDRLLPAGHPGALLAAGEMAAACLAARRGAEAVAWYQRVLADQTRLHGPEHPEAVAAQVGLGRALLAAGEPADAIATLRQVVSECTRLLGEGHASTLDAVDELAAAHRAGGQLSEATRLYRHLVTVQERAYGRRHPRTMTARARLGAVCMADGDIKASISLYKSVLSDCEAALGADDPETIAARASLASAYQAAGKMAMAARFAEQAYADSGRVNGADDPRTLACGFNLSLVYYAVGRVGDALILLRDMSARCARVLPPGDPLTSLVQASLVNLAGG